MASKRGNPLLRRWWRSQFRLRGLHRSQVVLLGVPLAVLIAIAGLEVWADAHDNWNLKRLSDRLCWRVMDWYPILFAPIATLFPFALLTALFVRWDWHRRFDALLSAPVTSRQWMAWLLAMAAGPTAVFLIGWWGCFFAFRWHPEIFNVITFWEKGFYLSLGYIPFQCLWSAAITLSFLSRCRRVVLGGTMALLCLLLPFAIGAGLTWLAVKINDRLMLTFFGAVNTLKIPILLLLLWDLHRHLRDRLAARLSP